MLSGELLAKAALLGLVEGVTEFIPVSSTSHLILVSHWLGETGEADKTFDIFIQLGATLALVIGGVLILLIERLRPVERVAEVGEVRPPTALGIGLAQVLSLVPGTSRSGATIMGGYALGLSRRAATDFSFFVSIPVMFAATLFDLIKSRGALSAADAPVFAVGFVTAFASALIVVRAFLGYVSRHSFAAFAWYRNVVGLRLLPVLR